MHGHAEQLAVVKSERRAESGASDAIGRRGATATVVKCLICPQRIVEACICKPPVYVVVGD